MRLKLKQNATIPVDEYGTQHPNAVIFAINHQIGINEKNDSIYKIGLYNDIQARNSKPINQRTFYFTESAVDPTYEQVLNESTNEYENGALLDTGHRGSAAIHNDMDFFLKDDQNIVIPFSPRTPKAKEWVLAQLDWNGVPFGDNWEFAE